MMDIAKPEAVPSQLKQPLIHLLLSLADDELVLGYWDSEWTGVAPLLEEDVACSSIAQDEIGHARVLYEEVTALMGTPPDQLVYGRRVQDYRQAQLVERHRGNWAFTMARQFLYDSVDQLRLANLRHSAYRPLAQDVVKIQQEESYHQMHTVAWMERLAHGTPEARHYLEQALESLWPDVPGLFEAFPDEELLVTSGILPTANADLQQEWFAAIEPVLERWNLSFPLLKRAASPAKGMHYHPTFVPRLGGRHGHHTQDFHLLWERMTKVYRLDPLANW